MIKATHPKNRAERLRLKEYHEKKKHKGASRRREEVRDTETQNDLDSYRSGNPDVT